MVTHKYTIHVIGLEMNMHTMLVTHTDQWKYTKLACTLT